MPPQNDNRLIKPALITERHTEVVEDGDVVRRHAKHGLQNRCGKMDVPFFEKFYSKSDGGIINGHVSSNRYISLRDGNLRILIKLLKHFCQRIRDLLGKYTCVARSLIFAKAKLLGSKEAEREFDG